MSRPRKIRDREQRLADANPSGNRAQRRAARTLHTEFDRLMNERARLILDGVDPRELAMPIAPDAGSVS